MPRVGVSGEAIEEWLDLTKDHHDWPRRGKSTRMISKADLSTSDARVQSVAAARSWPSSKWNFGPA
jgi:hypothetical protein